MSLTKISNNALSDITALPAGLPTGALTLLSTQTASSSASISFTSGIDSTYDSYIFKFIDIHPATDAAHFQFNFSIDSGSNYNVTKTSSFFEAYQNESGSASSLNYQNGYDLAQSTSYQTIAYSSGGSADESSSGYLQIFNPSSDTFVKHYISRFSVYNSGDYMVDNYSAGYANTTSAIDAIRFQMSSGNIDDGIIKMYGVS